MHENEFLVLLGPGRCGKTVLLNILANLEKQTSGTIEFAGGRPKMGDLGMVFQKYALFPWKTVMGNVEMSQKLKGVDKKVRQEKAQEYINLVGLKGFENSLPKQLSGGMKQRVGIARAYASESDIFFWMSHSVLWMHRQDTRWKMRSLKSGKRIKRQLSL